MTRRQWAKRGIGIVVILMLALALNQALRIDDQLQRLTAEGFRVDLRIEHNPLLVFDRQRQQGALVYDDRVERFALRQLVALEWVDDVSGGREPQAEIWLTLYEVPSGSGSRQLRISGTPTLLAAEFASLKALRQAADSGVE